MKIATGILLHAFFGFLYVQRAKSLSPNTVFVAMRDASDFEGTLFVISEIYDNFLMIPEWMQPGGAEVATQVSAFVRLATGEHFEAMLTRINGNENHDPYPFGPVVCEVRIGESPVFTTEPFEVYNPTHLHHPDFPYYPPENRVYVTVRGGPVYSAILLAPHQLATTHNKERLAKAKLVESPPEQIGESVHQTTQTAHQTSQTHRQTSESSQQTVQKPRQVAQPSRQTAQQPRQTAQQPRQRDHQAPHQTQPSRKSSKTQQNSKPR